MILTCALNQPCKAEETGSRIYNTVHNTYVTWSEHNAVNGYTKWTQPLLTSSSCKEDFKINVGNTLLSQKDLWIFEANILLFADFGQY